MSLMVSFYAVLFPTRCLNEILNLIESVSEAFLTTLIARKARTRTRKAIEAASNNGFDNKRHDWIFWLLCKTLFTGTIVNILPSHGENYLS